MSQIEPATSSHIELTDSKLSRRTLLKYGAAFAVGAPIVAAGLKANSLIPAGSGRRVHYRVRSDGAMKRVPIKRATKLLSLPFRSSILL